LRLSQVPGDAGDPVERSGAGDRVGGDRALAVEVAVNGRDILMGAAVCEACTSAPGSAALPQQWCASGVGIDNQRHRRTSHWNR
jgi:hypothetical protein